MESAVQMRCALLCLILVIWRVLVGSAVLGQQPVPVVSADSLAVMDLDRAEWIDPDAAAQLLTELAASGGSLSAAEWRRLALPQLGKGEASDPGESGPSAGWRGRISWRTRLSQLGVPVHSGRLQVSWNSLQGGVRWFETADGTTHQQGFAGWSGRHWRTLAGAFGWQWGYGLVCSLPGRWQGHSVATALVPRLARGRGYTGLAVPRAVQGGFLQGSYNHWQVIAFTGQPLTGFLTGTRRPVMALGLILGSDRGRVGILWSQQGEGRGGSLTLGKAVGAIQLLLEGTVWRTGAGEIWRHAWAAGARLYGDTWLLELVGLAADGAGAPLGRRPALLASWLGWGWALRGWKQVAGQARFHWLIAQSQGRSVSAALPASVHELHVELALRWRASAGWTCEVNHRFATESHRGWEDRHPWLPPELVRETVRSKTLVTWQGNLRWFWLNLSLRSLTEEKGRSLTSPRLRRQRQLLGIRAVWRRGADWDIRVGWNWAWGDDADLVSVTSIVPGYVSLRHWGHWQAETHVCAGWRRGGVRLQAGLARRVPVRGAPLQTWWEGLARIVHDW